MKRLKSDEFSYDNSYARQVSVTPSDPKHYMALPGNDKWENLRYVLEKQLGCFKFTLPIKVVQNSYLSAVFQYSVTGIPPGTPVSSKTQIYAGDIVVITRHPQPKHLHAYIPAKYWSDLGEVKDTTDVPQEAKHTTTTNKKVFQTEEEKLEALFQQQAPDDTTTFFLPPVVVRLLKQHILHPTDYSSLTTPHPLFVCQYCGNQGKHFSTLCPFTETDDRQHTTELVTKVRRLVGIPKSRLRFATEEEVALGQYYLNENNEKVVILPKEDMVLVASNLPKKNQAAARKPVVSPPVYEVVLDEDKFEAQFQFDFEEYIEEQDRLERERETQFYEKHPDLRKKKNQICTHYYRGMCHKGKLECEFLHSGDENFIAICQFFVNGQCTEANCIFRHPDKTQFNNECIAFKRGFCEKGASCKYKHVKFKHPSDNPDLKPEVCKAMVLALTQRKKRRYN